jgi:hypothetical protein
MWPSRYCGSSPGAARQLLGGAPGDPDELVETGVDTAPAVPHQTVGVEHGGGAGRQPEGVLPARAGPAEQAATGNAAGRPRPGRRPKLSAPGGSRSTSGHLAGPAVHVPASFRGGASEHEAAQLVRANQRHFLRHEAGHGEPCESSLRSPRASVNATAPMAISAMVLGTRPVEPPTRQTVYRSGRNAARISVANSSGSSQAAKWPPLSTSLK